MDSNVSKEHHKLIFRRIQVRSLFKQIPNDGPSKIHNCRSKRSNTGLIRVNHSSVSANCGILE